MSLYHYSSTTRLCIGRYRACTWVSGFIGDKAEISMGWLWNSLCSWRSWGGGGGVLAPGNIECKCEGFQNAKSLKRRLAKIRGEACEKEKRQSSPRFKFFALLEPSHSEWVFPRATPLLPTKKPPPATQASCKCPHPTQGRVY